MLALGSFTAEQHDYSALYGQTCSGVPSGRGCLFLTGGIVQTRRGPVGLTNGRGYVKRYAYDQCAFTDPPPKTP